MKRRLFYRFVRRVSTLLCPPMQAIALRQFLMSRCTLDPPQIPYTSFPSAFIGNDVSEVCEFSGTVCESVNNCLSAIALAHHGRSTPSRNTFHRFSIIINLHGNLNDGGHKNVPTLRTAMILAKRFHKKLVFCWRTYRHPQTIC